MKTILVAALILLPSAFAFAGGGPNPCEEPLLSEQSAREPLYFYFLIQCLPCRSQDDWISFMAMVDELLRSVNPNGGRGL